MYLEFVKVKQTLEASTMCETHYVKSKENLKRGKSRKTNIRGKKVNQRHQ